MDEIGLRDLSQIIGEKQGEEFVNREHWELELFAAYRSSMTHSLMRVGGGSVLFVDIPKGTPLRIGHEQSSSPALDVRFPTMPAKNQHFLYEPDLVSFSDSQHPARLWLPTTYVSDRVPGHEQTRLCYVFSGPQ